MNARYLLLVFASVACFSAAASAQNDTVTQVGHWSCALPGCGPHQGDIPFVCPSVPFPQKFGAPPNMIFPNNSPTHGFLFSGNADITSQGFAPRFSCSGFRGFRGWPTSTVTGDWIAVGARLHHGTIQAQYLVVSVVYAPPGSNNGKGPSSIQYQPGTATEATASASHSFKDGTSITASDKGGLVGKAELGLIISYSKSTTDDRSLDIKRSFLRGVTFAGPRDRDGLDHNLDQIILWLKPEVELATGPTSVAWTLVGGQDDEILPVMVGWLNGNIAPIPPTQLAMLQQARITPAEYCNILQRDPLAAVGPNCPVVAQASAPRAPRYLPLSDPVAYQAPPRNVDPPRVETVSVSDNSPSTIGSTLEDSYPVGLTTGSDAELLVGGGELKTAKTWVWTNKVTISISSGTSATAVATLGGPQFGYTGKTFIQIYLDTLYRTYAFALINDQPVALRGN
jgi:hypothetical protein